MDGRELTLFNERTMEAPREDRYKLLRATGVNTSPVIGLYDDPDGTGRPVLDAVTARPADVEVTDDDGVHHRLWAVPADGEAATTIAPLLHRDPRRPERAPPGRRSHRRFSANA